MDSNKLLPATASNNNNPLQQKKGGLPSPGQQRMSLSLIGGGSNQTAKNN